MAQQYSDPIYGSVNLSPLQEALGATEAVRRTAEIKSLGLASLVYKGANISREEHLFGASILGSRFAKAIELGKIDALTLEAALLLHDVGHLAFSHAAAKYFKEHGLEQEANAKRIILDDNSEVYQRLCDFHLDPEVIADAIHERDFVKKYGGALQYLKQLVSGSMDCDRLDFLPRDARRTAPYGQAVDVERLLQCAMIDRQRLVYREEARPAILAFFANYHCMYQAVYYNPKVNVLEAMLTRALFMKNDIVGRRDDLATISEHELKEILCSEEGDNTEDHNRATQLARRVFSGLPYSRTFTLPYNKGGLAVYEQLRQASPENFAFLEDCLLKMTGLKPGEIIIIDNYKPSEPVEEDVWIIDNGKVRNVVEVIPELKSLERRFRNRDVLVIAAAEQDHDIIPKALQKIFPGIKL